MISRLSRRIKSGDDLSTVFMCSRFGAELPRADCAAAGEARTIPHLRCGLPSRGVRAPLARIAVLVAPPPVAQDCAGAHSIVTLYLMFEQPLPLLFVPQMRTA